MRHSFQEEFTQTKTFLYLKPLRPLWLSLQNSGESKLMKAFILGPHACFINSSPLLEKQAQESLGMRTHLTEKLPSLFFGSDLLRHGALHCLWFV